MPHPAARHRAEQGSGVEDGPQAQPGAQRHRPPEGEPGPDFMLVRSDWTAMGELEDLAAVEDELEPFDAAEDDWRDLEVGEEDGDD